MATKKNAFHGFQGDVIFIKVNKIPTEGKKIKKTARGYVFAEGEHTGNFHSTVADIDCFDVNGKMYVSANESFLVEHQEHNNVTVEPGLYEIRIAKEFDHFAEEARQVRD
jgi:hypothetical protein